MLTEGAQIITAAHRDLLNDFSDTQSHTQSQHILSSSMKVLKAMTRSICISRWSYTDLEEVF